MSENIILGTFVTDEEMYSVYRDSFFVSINNLGFCDVIGAYLYSLKYEDGHVEYVYCECGCYERLFLNDK